MMDYNERPLFQTFKNPKPNLLAVLRETGSVPGDENGRKKGEESAKKRKRPEKGVCYLLLILWP